MDAILVINAGSSSLKFEVFGIERGLRKLVRGKMEGIGTTPHLSARDHAGTTMIDQAFSPSEVADLTAATRMVGGWLREKLSGNLVAVGHRVVHGGPDYSKPIRVDEKVLADLERFIPLAPLHQPNNLAPIRAFVEQMPQIPQVACFDTAFHRGHSAVADHYAIPEHYFAEGVRRYGFHGLSYEYIASRLPEVAPEIAAGRVIVAHLGSGASMCALRDGKSIESTLGFTALDGLPMGTRSGQIDPGVVLYLLSERGMSAQQVQDMLYKESGLKGLSGVSNDVRDLLESNDPRAEFALDHFVYRIGLYAGQLAAALGGLDAFVFTAGIGENSPVMRARIAEKLGWLGALIDADANAAGKTLLSQPGSKPLLFVIPTDEELMIARHATEVVRIHGLGAA
ncbi:acetate/propionate family kinase [Rhizobium sp. KVB221]|uniref:Acetate kinase n=1 Tax=Rhizobium setariae TaxID=2801340 RepID=A0A936YQ31_9HYPH|nr:acetate/propionate family kinase [Rhizobium setariae]MBL0373593.1 acetate/propionate family kinase [Rhizobium setariae]